MTGPSITLNGKKCTAGTATTVGLLLRDRAIDPTHVVVEVNRVIVQRDTFDRFPIGEGDTVEILRFVGGG